VDSGNLCPMGAAMEGDMVATDCRITPCVTVLMTVYDTPPRLLRQAIASIRNQTFGDFEFLILDDGSKQQATHAVLRQEAANDSRIRLLWEPHRGLTRSLNRCLQAAQGVWIARQDADDWSAPERLERQLEFLESHPERGLCGTAAWTHRQDGRPLWPILMPLSHTDILAAFPSRNPFVHGSAVFRAETARALGGYREEFTCSQDYDFFWRMAECVQTANLPAALYHYRYTGNAVSVGHAAEQEQAHRAARQLADDRGAGRREDVASALGRAGIELAACDGALRAAFKQADHRMLAGDFGGAGRDFVRLLRMHPDRRIAWGKFARWALFSTIPQARRACFR